MAIAVVVVGAAKPPVRPSPPGPLSPPHKHLRHSQIDVHRPCHLIWILAVPEQGSAHALDWLFRPSPWLQSPCRSDLEQISIAKIS